MYIIKRVIRVSMFFYFLSTQSGDREVKRLSKEWDRMQIVPSNQRAPILTALALLQQQRQAHNLHEQGTSRQSSRTDNMDIDRLDIDNRETNTMDTEE